MTILIHIGPPKTGTSAIQKALKIAENSNHLKLNGIKYLNNNISKNDILFFIAQIKSPLPRRYKQRFKPNLNAYRNNSFIYLNNLINKNHKNISLYISSSEFLFRINKDEIIKLRNSLLKLDKDIRVITFMRDPVELYISCFSQNIKNSTLLTLPLETNHYQQLLIWEEIFKNKFYVYDYDKCMYSGNILLKFRDIVNNILKENNKNKIELKTELKENQSVSSELTHAIYKFRKINNLVNDQYYDFLKFSRIKVGQITKSNNLNKLILTSEAKELFIKNNRKLYDLLENKYNFQFKYEIQKSLSSKKRDINYFKKFNSIINNYDRKVSDLIYNFLDEETKKFRNPIQFLRKYLRILIKNFFKKTYFALLKFKYRI